MGFAGSGGGSVVAKCFVCIEYGLRRDWYLETCFWIGDEYLVCYFAWAHLWCAVREEIEVELVV